MRLTALIAAALLTAAPAFAAEPAETRIMPAGRFADLQEVVAALGHEIEAQDPSKQSLRAAAQDGTRYVLTGTACDIEGVPGCRGVVVQVLFEATEAVTLERLTAANLNQVAVSTRFDPGTNVISVTRYIVMDGGVTMANVAENVAVALALAPEVVAALFAPAEGASGPG